MKLKSALAGRSYYRRIYADVSMEDIFNLRKEVVSYTEIKPLSSDRG